MNPSTGSIGNPEAQFSPKGSKIRNVAQVQPEIKRRGCFVHRMKTLFHKPAPSINPTDSELEAAMANCERLSNMYSSLKLHIINYVRHVQGLIVTSNTVASELALAVDDNFVADLEAVCTQYPKNEDQPFKYSRIVALVKHSHENSNAVKAATLAEKFEKSSVPLLEQQIIEINKILPRIEIGKKLRAETDYYIEKLNKLNERRLNGKPMTGKENARLERNQIKLKEIESVYNQFITQLLDDLEYFFGFRLQVLGQVINYFVQTELDMAEIVNRGKVSDSALSDLQAAMMLFVPASEAERLQHRRASVSKLKDDSRFSKLWERSVSKLTERSNEQSSLNNATGSEHPERPLGVPSSVGSVSEYGTPKRSSRAIVTQGTDKDGKHINIPGNTEKKREKDIPDEADYDKVKLPAEQSKENFDPVNYQNVSELTQYSYEKPSAIDHSPEEQSCHYPQSAEAPSRQDKFIYLPNSKDISPLVSENEKRPTVTLKPTVIRL